MKRLGLVLALLAAFVAAFLAFQQDVFTPSDDDPTPAPTPAGAPAAKATPVRSARAEPPRAAPGQPAVQAAAPLPGPPPSPFSRDLARPDLPPAEAPKIVLKMFDAYRSRFGAYPSGGQNREFVNALTGNNPKALPILDRASPALNAKGELLDGWGTPYFFHLISRDYLEVRSAGPDRVMYTADDVVVPPPQKRN